MRAIFYLLVIVLANVVTAKFNPLQMGIFIIPWGTFLIGATFVLRDIVQNKYGRSKTYLFIFIALLLSALISHLQGDTLWIVFASAISFAVSESTDTEIYTRLKSSMVKRVFYSGTVGGILDSTIFVIIGLSPLGANFVPWNLVWEAKLGQIIFKTVMQGIGILVIKLATRNKTELN
jgi:uncharacterized PurR-regulated membrane protein YhhQ (DUF165 family)